MALKTMLFSVHWPSGPLKDTGIKKIVLVYMLVQQLNHCRNDWQNINMIANDILTFIFIKLLAINGITGN